MDPLSISASIAGLVTLAEVVFGRACKYTRSVGSASKDIANLSSEIGALYDILSNLRLLAEQLESETHASNIRALPIHACFETLEKVKHLLGGVEGPHGEKGDGPTFKENLRWPLKSSEIKNLVAEVERHKATLGLALNAESMSGLLQALSKQTKMGEGLRNIQREMQQKREADVRVAMDEQKQEVLKSFGSLDPRTNHDTSRKLRHHGIGLWLTESREFEVWQSTANAKLWLYGIPGAGKTVIASLIIDEVLSATNATKAAAYFYCDYKDSNTQKPHKILASLVQQLAKQDEQSFAKVQKFYATHGEGRMSPCAYDPELLCVLLRKIALDFEQTMIVVDGLDECGVNARLVTELLLSLCNGSGNTNINIVFLSRDEIEIRQCLDEYPNLSIAARSSDLRLYVGAEIESRTRKRLLKVKFLELKDLIAERLVEGAEGM